MGEGIGEVEEALVEDDADVIIRSTRLRELTEVDQLADRLLQPLIDHFDDVAVVRDAVLMAISELCQNAVEGVRSVSYSFADELIGVFATRYEADHQALRPVVIGLSAQAQRVVLGSLEQRGLPDEVSRELVPH